jgi:hypothetical protein
VIKIGTNGGLVNDPDELAGEAPGKKDFLLLLYSLI